MCGCGYDCEVAVGGLVAVAVVSVFGVFSPPEFDAGVVGGFGGCSPPDDSVVGGFLV